MRKLGGAAQKVAVIALVMGPLAALLIHRATAVPTLAMRTKEAEPLNRQAQLASTLELSQQMLAQNRALETVKLLELALVEHPRNAKLYNNLCVARGLLKQRTLAVAACRQALELEPNFQLAAGNLTWVSNLTEETP